MEALGNPLPPELQYKQDKYSNYLLVSMQHVCSTYLKLRLPGVILFTLLVGTASSASMFRLALRLIKAINRAALTARGVYGCARCQTYHR